MKSTMRSGMSTVPGGTGGGELERSDDSRTGAGIHREQIRQPLFGFEANLGNDGLGSVIGVVDLDFVKDLRVEREPVRSVARFR